MRRVGDRNGKAVDVDRDGARDRERTAAALVLARTD